MLPSQTSIGKAWIDNFESVDQATATALLDALRIVDLGGLWTGIDTHLQTLLVKGEIEAPAVVVPERSLKYFGFRDERSKARAVAYRDFHPGAPLSATPGSDGFVGALLRDLNDRSSGAGSEWIRPQAKLKELRKLKCRWIVIATDYCGTGRQVATFANSLTRNKTIRSWRSRGWIKIGVLAFAASSDAIERLEKTRSVDRIWTTEVAPTLDTARWDATTHEAVVRLCQQEARGKQAEALGWENTGGLFVTARGVPNNVPAVFTQQGKDWTALFPGRSVPSDFAMAVANYQPAETLKEFAERIGQVRLGRNDRLRDMRGVSMQLVAALALGSQAECAEVPVAGELGVERSNAKALVSALQRWGFIDEVGALTDAGRAELAAHKRGRRRTTAFAEGDRTVYYPQQLR